MLRTSHPSTRGPRHLGRGAGLPVVGTAVVAVLAVAVVVLAFRLRDESSSEPERADLAALETRVAELDGELTALGRTARDLARQTLASLDKADKAAAAASGKQATRQRLLARCLGQVQRQVDDLQAYLALGTSPRRDRVSGGCVSLLQPRFRP